MALWSFPIDLYTEAILLQCLPPTHYVRWCAMLTTFTAQTRNFMVYVVKRRFYTCKEPDFFFFLLSVWFPFWKKKKTHESIDERFETTFTSSLQSADLTATVVWARFSYRYWTAANYRPTSYHFVVNLQQIAELSSRLTLSASPWFTHKSTPFSSVKVHNVCFDERHFGNADSINGTRPQSYEGSYFDLMQCAHAQ